MTNERSSSFSRHSALWAILWVAPAMLGARGCDTAVVGSECDGSPGQCGSGHVCELPAGAACGTSERKGSCRPAGEAVACTAELAPVCGCDGQTYGNACAAAKAGATVVSEGACAGTPCGGQSGTVCGADQFCRFAPEADCGSGDQTGTCEPIPGGCNSIYIDAVLCGCDGATYATECEAELAGTSIRGPGECPRSSDGRICGGLTGAQCAPSEFCNFPIEAICGSADGTGTCEAVPEACTEILDPVCGCDGVSYGNACDAHSKGQSIASVGACAPASDSAP
jgi:Kazal-type serine protease inhibitor-like protein